MGLPDWSIQRHGFARIQQITQIVSCFQSSPKSLLDVDGAGELSICELFVNSPNINANDNINIDIDGSTFIGKSITSWIADASNYEYSPVDVVYFTAGVNLLCWIKPGLPFTSNFDITYRPNGGAGIVYVRVSAIIALLP
jgi:hypothetical protein